MFLPACLNAQPFIEKKESEIEIKVYECVNQHSSDLLRAIKPIKPLNCKLSNIVTGDKIIIQGKNSLAINQLYNLLKTLDKPSESIKLKLYWVALQSKEAEDLMKILDQEDLNVKNLWRCLLKGYLHKGLARTMACPQIQTIIGKSFCFQSDEVSVMVPTQSGKRSCYKEQAGMRLGVSGLLHQLSSGHYLLDLDLKYRLQIKEKEEQPKSEQVLKTQIKLKKGFVYSVGGIYQCHLYQKKQGNLITRYLPWTDQLIETKNSENLFFSALFIEVI